MYKKIIEFLKDKYNIKKLFGYLRNVDNITVSDISIDSSNMWHAVFNGTRVNLQTVAPNGMGFDGDILTYVEIYVPYYDGNKYEVFREFSKKNPKIYNSNLKQRHFRKTHCYFWIFVKQ